MATLPVHHKKNGSVDWDAMSEAVASLSRVRRTGMSPEEVLEVAKHLAEHYRKAHKPLPDVLASLV